MRPRKFKRFWICRHGHPMWRKPGSGHWVCHTCNDLNLNHSKDDIGSCRYGHKRLMGVDCPVCKIYRSTPWLKQLDAVGKGECSKGHEVSHHDDSIVYSRTKKQKARYCRACFEGALIKARALAPDFKANPMCRRGLHQRTEENTRFDKNGKRQCKPCWEDAQRAYHDRADLKREKASGLRSSHVDWVVVERLLAKGQMDYLRRGTHRGPTDGERWVAYCTFRAMHGGRHPEEMYGEVGYDAMRLWKLSAWRDLGKKYRWREFTLSDLVSIMDTEEYLTGGFLLKYKKRENPRP